MLKKKQTQYITDTFEVFEKMKIKNNSIQHSYN